jgi:hypothetical protein
MASGKYEGLSQLFLNWLFNGGTFAQPSNLYLALYTVAPTVSTTGTEVTNAGAYARVTMACNTTNWPTISGSTTTVSNGVAFTFAAATATWSSGSNITDAGIISSGTYGSGTLYYWGDVTVAKPVFNGDTASFAINALTVQEL